MFVIFVSVPNMFDGVPVDDVPPVRPIDVGVPHVYVVFAGTIPFVVCVGVTLKITPLQVVLVIGVITGVGLTVTVTVNVAPAPQVSVVGVTI